MTEPSPVASGRIFVSYRREETAYPAGWLYERLAERFGAGQVFKDVDSIQLGDDFVEVITRAVGSCDVLLALIGDEWLNISDSYGRRRIDVFIHKQANAGRGNIAGWRAEGDLDFATAQGAVLYWLKLDLDAGGTHIDRGIGLEAKLAA